MKNEDIAKVCHAVNTAYCHGIGDDTAMPWDEASDGQKTSAVEGVGFHLDGGHTPEESHKAWMDFKINEGWKFGEVKDEEKKEHPCLVAYDDLPEAQRVKDFLFAAVVDSMALIGTEIVKSIADMDDGDEKKMPITYIGKREQYYDIYVKGLVWEKGETKRIVNSVARKMLAHFDVYSKGEAQEDSEVVDDVDDDSGKNENINLDEETKFQISLMTRKAHIVEFIKNQWGIETEVGKKTVKDLQEEAVMHIDNLGLVGND